MRRLAGVLCSTLRRPATLKRFPPLRRQPQCCEAGTSSMSEERLRPKSEGSSLNKISEPRALKQSRTATRRHFHSVARRQTDGEVKRRGRPPGSSYKAPTKKRRSDQIKRSTWTNEEIEKLLRYRREGMTLREIAAAIPTHSIYSLSQRYYRVLRHVTNDQITRRTKRWSAADSQRLKHLRRSGMGWEEIHSQFPDRTSMSLRIKYKSLIDRPPVASGRPWTPAEDQMLLQGRRKFHLPWSDILLRIPGRSERAAKMRYYVLDVVSPLKYLSRRNMTRDEVDRCVRLYQSGYSWYQISKMVPGPSRRSSRGHEGMARQATQANPHGGARSRTDDEFHEKEKDEVHPDNRWSTSSIAYAVRAAIMYPEGPPPPRPWTLEEERRLLAMDKLGQVNLLTPWGVLESEFNRTVYSCVAKRDELRRTARHRVTPVLEEGEGGRAQPSENGSRESKEGSAENN